MAHDGRSAILAGGCSSQYGVVASKAFGVFMSDTSARSQERARACQTREIRRRATPSMLERLRENNARVSNAESRLMLQRSFIQRLEAAKRDTTAAEESLEVMRNLLGELYQERSALRRQLAGRSRQKSAPGQRETPRQATKAQKSPA